MLRFNSDRAKYAIFLIMLDLLLVLISTLAIVVELICGRESIINTFIDSWGYCLIVDPLISILSVIFFLLWFIRAYFNLQQQINSFSYSTVWACVSWFIPIINFITPYKIMTELYTKTNYLVNLSSVDIYVDLNQEYVDYWWLLWVIVLLLSISINVDDIVSPLYNLYSSILRGILYIPLSILTIRMIRKYDIAESVLYEQKSL